MPFVKESLLGKATQKGLLNFGIHNLRDYTTDKHKTVDDTPYGGGAGMVMKIEPIDRALHALNDQIPMTNDPHFAPLIRASRGRQLNPNDQLTKKRRIAVLSARGEQFTQAKAEEYARLDELVLICGRYEGIDQRVADNLADEEISIGPYVLNGGEVAAMVVIEAVARLLPGVLGNEDSLKEESFTGNNEPQTTLGMGRSASRIEYPQYTKPAEYNGWKVPEVLLSGNHEEIRKWREGQKKKSAR